MDIKQIEALARQAVLDSVIEVECPVCGAIIISEPDAEEFYCDECEKVTARNPLTELGFI